MNKMMNETENSQHGPEVDLKSDVPNKLQETRVEVDKVIKIMQDNVNKVLERDDKLHKLDDKADALLLHSSQFQSQAVTLRRKMWWKNKKMMLLLGSVGAFLFLFIIL
ncbi:synaptobrevin-like [Planococcus citri]|uniref:synaptobrevin-like n=1 Tax=Planococcus citri TaxID=170843 RepID=UPI0031F8620C